MTTVPNTSVDQIFDTLELLSGTPEPVGVVDLARSLSLPASTAHRLLVTLQDAGFAERDSTGAKYELGSRAYELVHGLFGHYGVRRASLPFLTRLMHRTDETTTLDVRVGWFTVRMAGFEGRREIHAGTLIGRTQPLADTASGHAILARLSDDAIGQYLAWQAQARPGPRADELREELDAVRRHGFARLSAGDGDATELSFPVCHDGQALAAVSLNGMGALVAGRHPDRREIARCQAVIADLEALLVEQPHLAQDPFAHLDPRELGPLPGYGRASR
jgi:IclR family transcriptional regulator, KDG regulon repressor